VAMSEHEHKKNGEKGGDGIALSERELAQVTVIVVLGVFLVFLAGYFLGKRRMCEELAQGDEVRFADKIHRALTNFANRAEESMADEEEEGGEVVEAATPGDEGKDGKAEEKPEIQAYAQLCGFATEAAAKGYLDKLAKRGIKSRIIDKTSKSGRGRKVAWFQVVTETMNRQELVDLVESIKKQDKLSKVTIVDLSE